MTGPNTPPSVAERKAQIRARQQQYKDERKARKRKQRDCYWTKPRGHAYERAPGYRWECVGCGKSKGDGADY